MRVVQWVAAVAILGGGLVLTGYGVFVFAREFFTSDDVALPVKIAVPVIGAGFVALAVVVVVQKLKTKEDTTVKGIEH
jgi:hypothetical protein